MLSVTLYHSHHVTTVWIKIIAANSAFVCIVTNHVDIESMLDSHYALAVSSSL